MTLASGRADRRRRILSDGRLTGDVETKGDSTDGDRTGGAPRYTADPSSVSFGLASRVLPTGAWSLAGVATAAVVMTASLTAADLFRTDLARYVGEPAAALLDATSPNSLASLTTTITAVLLVALTGVVFGLRRKRSDDVRGVYRWWLTGASMVGIVGVCLATGAHAVVASAIAAQVGWSPLAGDALWWLAPAMLLAGGVAVRLFLDLKESRLAAAGAVFATVAAIVAVAAGQGWAPAAAEPYLAATGFAATQAALIGAAFATLAYMRRIVLESDGRAAAPAKKEKKEKKATAKEESPQPLKIADTKKEKPATKPAATSTSTASRKASSSRTETPAAESRKPAAKAAASKPASQATATEWIDGSQGDTDDYGDENGGRRRLSKAERKRLRKQKARQQRAA